MKKKLLVSLLVTVALICTCALAASAVGTLADDGVFEISQAEELRDLAYLIAEKGDGYGAARKASYRLTKDIDMSEITDMIPIGANSGNAFTGTFDGNWHKIYNLNLVPAEGASGHYWGLFGRVADATITDLTVEGTVTSGGAYVGGIVGLVATNAKIENCTNLCTVTYTGTATAYGVGGVVGHAGGKDKVNTVTAGSKQTGTLVITNCRNEGDVLGSKCVGGILGRSDITSGSVTVTGCVNTGDITATIGDTGGYADVGGIAGFDYGEKGAATRHLFSGCTNLGTVAFAKLTDYDFSGFTKGLGFQGVGGIIGRTQTTGIEVTGCYNGGKVTSDGRDANGTSGDSYAMVIVGKSPVAPKNSNNYYKPGAGAMNSVKAIAVGLTEESTTAAIWQDGNATVRYITRLTGDDAAAVEKYGIMIAKVDDNVDAKYAALTDSFEGTETTYAVDLVGIPETARDINIYAWAYVNLAGGVQIVLPVAPVTVNGIIG
mgnify:FL=1